MGNLPRSGLPRGSDGILALIVSYNYSYEGVLLAEIPIPHSTSRYSLDPENGHLYLLEPDSETIIRYDIADLRGMLP